MLARRNSILASLPVCPDAQLTALQPCEMLFGHFYIALTHGGGKLGRIDPKLKQLSRAARGLKKRAGKARSLELPTS
ncbi:MAG TPA: hypothetical protein VFK19_11280 [Sphingomicrobium sp.]|nr:hypothetical protein [Sphingomicrobium sp.]